MVGATIGKRFIEYKGFPIQGDNLRIVVLIVVMIDTASACIAGLGQGLGLAILKEDIRGIIRGLPPTPARSQMTLRQS